MNIMPSLFLLSSSSSQRSQWTSALALVLLDEQHEMQPACRIFMTHCPLKEGNEYCFQI